MYLSDISEALREARNVIQRIESQAYQVGNLAADDSILRKMQSYQLKKLKKKLQSYNAQTGVWK